MVGQVLVIVEDSGNPRTQDELFSAFFTTKRGGMGLSISRFIVEAHGGRMWATPNVPHGAIFHFSLPAAASPLRRHIAPQSGPISS